MVKADHFHILYTFNHGFEMQVATSICSVCENNKSTAKITFHLFIQDVSEKDQAKIKSLVKKYNRDVIFYDIGNIKNYFNFDFNSHGWHPIILARLLLDKFLPNSINRVLYLDGDTMIRKSLADLFNTDLHNKTIGMSAEPTIDLKRIAKFNLGQTLYCNSGVMLIDLKRWRKLDAGTKIINFYTKNHSELFAPDQDAIMCVMKNEIQIISPTYNFGNLYYQYPYNFFKKRLLPNQYVDKKTFNDAVKDPTIIHFLGEDRPWRAGNTHKYSAEYKNYQSKTPWKNFPDEQGWQTYYLFWKIFNILIYPFPKLRLFIINRLIPLFKIFNAKKLKNKEKIK